MRSRPKVKTLLRPGVATPGAPLYVEVVLESATETPVDFVEIRLDGIARTQFGRYGSSHGLLALAARHGARVLGVGEHRLPARFDLPRALPPTYRGGAAGVDYTLAVHVSIPWWPDRRQSFTVPVAPVAEAFAPTPQTVVTTLEGPRGTAPYVEVAYDSTTLEIGGVLAGAVSVANTMHSTIRGIDLLLVATEASKQGFGSHQPYKLRWRIHDGTPPEGAPIPFRVALARDLAMSMALPIFDLRWHLEVVVDVAWGSDARLTTAVKLVPPTPETPSRRERARAARWVAPVGRERRALIWATVAEKHGMVNDAEHEKMSATIGAATIVIGLQQRGTDGLYSIATLTWPDLGIDLLAERRTWTDVFAVGTIRFGDADAGPNLTARAREAAQARALLSADTLPLLVPFEEVRIDDEGATLAARGGAQTLPQLDGFVSAALAATRALALGIARVPPPATMATFVAAWEASAVRLGGKLERGGMRIESTTFGADAIEIETLWSRDAKVEGTAVRVLLSPPLDRAIDVASPDLSREARDLATVIAGEAKKTRLGPDALEALVDGPVDDPARVEPLLEKLARLARAARGLLAAGPFR